MRQRHAFLLILIQDETEPAVLRGRVRHVASETETAFSGVDQLVAFLQAPNHFLASPPGTSQPPISERKPQLQE
jgi:hypothetical protein